MHSEEAKRQAVNEENYKRVKKDQTKEHWYKGRKEAKERKK